MDEGGGDAGSKKDARARERERETRRRRKKSRGLMRLKKEEASD